MTSSIIDNCGICRDKLDSSLTTLECKHVFHTECIDAWTARVSTCPFCRHPVVKIVRTILERARLGIFEYEFDIIEAIEFNGELVHTEMMSLIIEGYISQNGIIKLIEGGYIINDDTISSIIDHNYIDEYAIHSLCVNGYISESIIMNLIQNEFIINKHIIHNLCVDILTNGDIIDLITANILTLKNLRNIITDKILELCKYTNVKYSWRIYSDTHSFVSEIDDIGKVDILELQKIYEERL